MSTNDDRIDVSTNGDDFEAQVWALQAELNIRTEDEAALKRAIQILRDETDPVIAAAERLTQDALGDSHLWAATRPLREALRRCPTRLDANGDLWRTGGDA